MTRTWDRSYWTRLLAIIIAWMLLSTVSTAVSETFRVGWFRANHVVESPSDTNIVLPSRIIVRDSVRIHVDELRLIPSHDYSVDYESHTIRLTRLWPIGSVVHIEYRALPVNWPRTHVWMRPVTPKTDSTESPFYASVVSRMDTVPATTGDLRIGGTKTFAIQVGSNRDLTLEQSLRVSVNGTVGEDVYVTAELSDQNLPIQPEGTTENIKEIDKVLVQIESPHYQAVLGNYDLTWRRGEFGSYDRRLEGAQVAVRYDRFTATGGVASARGVFHTIQLPIIDGTQGPYELTDDSGNPNIIVIAGSEHVWLDGQPLRRGLNNDYVMDYSAGEITFTRSRLITNDMRIVVDYEYAGEQYARSSGILSAEAFGREKTWRTAVFFAQESDNHSDPLAFQLDDAALSLLRDAGDNKTDAAREGWSENPDGAYTALDIDNAVFSYVGTGLGGYNVRFSAVPPGEGTYVKQSGILTNAYEYVGTQRGNYVPFILYPLPERTRVATIWTQADPTEWLSANAEIAMSDFDRNTLSSKDDGDNRRFAGRMSLQGKEMAVGSDGTLSITAIGRAVQKGFVTLSRTRQPEDNRRWGLPLQDTRGQERTLDFSAQYAPAPRHALTVEAGVFDRDTIGTQPAYTARRTGFLWKSNSPDYPTVFLHAEAIASEASQPGEASANGTFYRGESEVRHTIAYLRPSVGMEAKHEELQKNGRRIQGERFAEWSSELATTGVPHIASSVALKQRVDQAWDTTLTNWEDRQRSLMHTWRSSLREWQGVNANAEYSWRRSTGEAVGGESISDAADVDISYDPWDGIMRHDLRYQVSSTRTADRERIYVFAGAGRGTYRPVNPDEIRPILSDDEVLPVASGDPDGSYVLRYEDTDRFRPTVRLDASYRLGLNLHRAWRGAPDPRSNRKRPLWQRVARNISTQTQLQISEIDTVRNKKLYTAQFWTFRKPGVSPTLRGTWSLLQDAVLWPTGTLGDVRLRARIAENYDATLLQNMNEGTTDPNVTKSREFSVRMRRRIPTWKSDWTAEGTRQFENQTGSRFEYRARRWLLEQTFAYHPTFQSEIAMRGEVGLGSDPTPDAAIASDPNKQVRAYLIALEPVFRRGWGRQGMVRMSAQWSGVYTDNLATRARLPIQLLDGRTSGSNYRWTALLNYRLSSLVTASMTYTGKKTPGSDAIHTGRMEMRAVF
jgi:hypothetical protein